MTDRPASLAALATGHLVLGVINLLGVIFAGAALARLQDPTTLQLVRVGASGVLALSMMISGIGLFLHARVLGRGLGSLTGVLLIVLAGPSLVERWSVMSLVLLVYGGLTLYLLNVRLRDHLTARA